MRIIYDQTGLKPPGAIQPILPAGAIHRPVLVMRLVSDRMGPGDIDGRKTEIDPTTGRESGQIVPGHEPEGKWKTSEEALERDRSVRHHENTHLSALGPYAASGILYTTATGADGETLAVGGRIAVDLAEIPGDPETTLRKARIVLNAANAPGDPSAADQRVAARAYRLMQTAKAELRVDTYA
jgi:hypothetical protein